MRLSEQLAVRSACFVLCVLLGAYLFLDPLKELAVLSREKELYSHVVLVPLVSLYFLVTGRRIIFSEVRTDYGAALPLVIAAPLLYALGVYFGTGLNQNDRLSLMIAGFLAALLGAFLLCFGRRAFNEALFPLLFLAFAVPIPSVILDPLISLLQRGSTEAAYLVLKLIGVPIYRDGFVFSLPGLDVEVAPQCSGIRSSIALLITSVLAGYLFLSSKLNRLYLALSVFPIAMFKNGLRIVTISLLASYVDMRFLTDHWIHSSGGIPFFVVALLLLVPVVWLLRRRERERGREEYRRQEGEGGQRS